MAVTMEKIRSADRNAGACGFNRSECGVIVYHIIGDENLLPATVAHVERRKIVERARSADSSEQPGVFLPPEAMLYFRLWLFY
jgi:hypothetical protein